MNNGVGFNTSPPTSIGSGNKTLLLCLLTSSFFSLILLNSSSLFRILKEKQLHSVSLSAINIHSLDEHDQNQQQTKRMPLLLEIKPKNRSSSKPERNNNNTLLKSIVCLHVLTMGRKIPIADDVSLLHPVLSLSLLMAWMAATVAMITALCIRRKSSSSPAEPSSSVKVTEKSDHFPSTAMATNTETTMVPPSPPQATTTVDSQGKTANDDDNSINSSQLNNKELPLPPAMKTLRETYSCNNLTRTMSMKKIDSSLSMKIGRSISVRNQDQNKKKGKLFKSDQDSVWTKTIILGEKCKPDEDDTIIYDNKGNRISTYHKKTQSNFSLSRTNSFIDQTAIPGVQDQKDKGIMRKDEEGELVQVNE